MQLNKFGYVFEIHRALEWASGNGKNHQWFFRIHFHRVPVIACNCEMISTRIALLAHTHAHVSCQNVILACSNPIHLSFFKITMWHPLPVAYIPPTPTHPPTRCSANQSANLVRCTYHHNNEWWEWDDFCIASKGGSKSVSGSGFGFVFWVSPTQGLRIRDKIRERHQEAMAYL